MDFCILIIVAVFFVRSFVHNAKNLSAIVFFFFLHLVKFLFSIVEINYFTYAVSWHLLSLRLLQRIRTRSREARRMLAIFLRDSYIHNMTKTWISFKLNCCYWCANEYASVWSTCENNHNGAHSSIHNNTVLLMFFSSLFERRLRVFSPICLQKFTFYSSESHAQFAFVTLKSSMDLVFVMLFDSHVNTSILQWMSE